VREAEKKQIGRERSDERIRPVRRKHAENTKAERTPNGRSRSGNGADHEHRLQRGRDVIEGRGWGVYGFQGFMIFSPLNRNFKQFYCCKNNTLHRL